MNMEATPKKIVEYVTPDGKNPFRKWMDSLRDRARVKVDLRLDRAAVGNFGDTRSVGDGVHELRIKYGPGYRIYFANDGEKIVLLLTGGDKRTQDKDIKQSKIYWMDYKKERR